MNKQEMAAILFDLRKELEENKQLDKYEVKKSQALAEEIERRINDPQADLSGDKYLLAKLKEATIEFEEKHPKLTEIVGRMSDLLARMGV